MQTDSILWTWVKSLKRTRIAITVTSKGAVEVKTPKNASIMLIEAFLRDKAHWIIKQQQRQETRIGLALPAYAKEGELYFFGKKIIFLHQMARVTKVAMHEERIVIYAKDQAAFERALLSWYEHHTKIWVAHYVAQHAHKVPHTVSAIAYRKYKRRWGSCDAKNKLVFNKLLSLLSHEHMEYVVVHELSHLVHKHHKKAFWHYGETLLGGFRNLHKAML